MASLSSDGKYVTVERGDTLCAIARTYAGGESNYKKLATINNIANPSLIYVGQKIYLDKTDSPSTPSSGSTKVTINNRVASITAFGLQADVDNSLYATWRWTPPIANTTSGYDVEWDYYTRDGVWFNGDHSTVENGIQYSIYSIPTNATQIRFRIKPVSTTYTYGEGENQKEVNYWDANWTSYEYFYASSIPPEAPSAPSISVSGFQLTAKVTGLDDEITAITFQLLNESGREVSRNASPIKVINGDASYTFTMSAGHKYKVRAYSWKGNIASKDWSDYSEETSTPPLAPSGINGLKVVDESSTEVQVTWTKSNNATGYEIEYTTNKIYFDSGGNTSTFNVDMDTSSCIITGLTSGSEIFFRLRAKNDVGESNWTEIKSIILGEKPSTPTTWSSTNVCIVGEKLILYWAHNSLDGSEQKAYAIQLYLNGVEQDLISGTGDTSFYEINTSSYPEGTTLQWKVKTCGITGEYSDWSIQRSVSIYAAPSLDLKVTDQNGVELSTITSFPFYIKAKSSPATQTPIGYQIEVYSKNQYNTYDYIGREITISEKESIYSKYVNNTGDLIMIMTAGDIDLENGMEYMVSCTVAMNSGLSANSEYSVSVSWDEQSYTPNAEIGLNRNNYTTIIQPYCTTSKIQYFKVLESNGVYTRTTDEIDYVGKTEYYMYKVTKSNETYIKSTDLIDYVRLGEIDLKEKTTTGETVYKGILLDGNEVLFCKVYLNAKTTTGDIVYMGTTADGDDVFYCIDDNTSLVPNVILSVYRREYDGSFTEIAKNLENSRSTYVVDPHPSLDYARYRIVATYTETGSIGFYDLPGYPVNGTSIIIQWDEAWNSFDTYGSMQELSKPEWSGSLVELPYNITVSDSYSKDQTAVSYIGRENPVTYYGTQLGETSSWTTSIPASDKDTLYALRRLARWMGDVYVREPSGIGYWATINVTLNQSYSDLTIPVTLDITRVEGGI